MTAAERPAENMKITKGPWVFSPENGEVYSGAEHSSVCMVLMNWDGEANGKLIAAAPDLLEALKSLSEASRNACDAKQHTPLIEALFDPTFLSSNISGNTAKEIAAHIELALQAKGVVVGQEHGEWHRADSERSILLYTLKQDGWRKGEPAMVNDLTVRIENAAGSENDLGPIADRILACLQLPAVVSDDLRARIKKAIMLEVQFHDLAHEDEDGSVTVTNSQIDLLDVVCDKAADRVLAALSPKQEP